MSSTHTKQSRIGKAALTRTGRAPATIKPALTVVPSIPATTTKPAPRKRRKAAAPKITTPKAPVAPRELENQVLFTPPPALYFDNEAGRAKTANILEDFVQAFADDTEEDPKLRERNAWERALSIEGAPSKGWLKHLISSLRGNTRTEHNPGGKVAKWLRCRIQKRMIPLTPEELAELAKEQAKKKTTKR